jgi:hypothetical protein
MNTDLGIVLSVLAGAIGGSLQLSVREIIRKRRKKAEEPVEFTMGPAVDSDVETPEDTKEKVRTALFSTHGSLYDAHLRYVARVGAFTNQCRMLGMDEKQVDQALVDVRQMSERTHFSFAAALETTIDLIRWHGDGYRIVMRNMRYIE